MKTIGAEINKKTERIIFTFVFILSILKPIENEYYNIEEGKLRKNSGVNKFFVKAQWWGTSIFPVLQKR